MTRRRLSDVLVALTAVVLIAAAVAGYARLALLDADRFADRATASVRDDSVRTLIAERVTDEVLRQQADLLAARPVISSAIAGIVGSGPFESLFRRALLDAHHAVFARDRDTIALTLLDVGVVAGAALREVDPRIADRLEESGRITLLENRVGSVTGDLARTAERLRTLAYLLAALALAAASAALALSGDRRQTAFRLGVATAVAGAAIVIAYTIARAGIVGRVSGADERAAAGAVWDAYLEDLKRLGWLLAAAGAVVSAAAASLVRPAAFAGPLGLVRRWAITKPVRPSLRLLRAGALIVAGVLVLIQPLAALEIAATLIGLLLIYAGATTVLGVVYRPPKRTAPGRKVQPSVRRLAVPVVAALFVGVAITAFVATGGTESDATPTGGTSACNGSAALCDRSLPEVVLPATHNSMSAPQEGWFSTQQDDGIAAQLEAGIRGLLIDTHYAERLPNGRVRTLFSSPPALAQTLDQDAVTPQSFRAAMRLRDRLGFRGQGQRGLYMCHTFCELGATPLSNGLDDIHDFLVTHPAEVVVVINQDAISPTDFVQAVGDAGLAPYVFTPPADSSWPTLRAMVDEGRRLVVLAEDRAGAAPWYQLAYRRLVNETPYSFRRPSQLFDDAASCRPNRGPPQAPLFLVNHWVTTDPVPRPSNAAKVNAYGPLLARARACRRLREQLPNLLAVDFYKRGDLFRVTRTLNREE
ncbi:MAG TPA: hypothetical protein VEX36_09635 [Thermoleophilaceae bacterium]|nr:hypothetical protein [Thermoleophilaceae bacterium]